MSAFGMPELTIIVVIVVLLLAVAKLPQIWKIIRLELTQKKG